MQPNRANVLDGTIIRLLIAAFVVALGTTGFIFAVPFYVLGKLGRTDAVGQVVAVWTAGYIVNCLVAQRLIVRMSPRLLVSLATLGVATFMFLFRFTETALWMSLAGLGYGLSLGLFWAPLMGWLSGDAEGVTLSRRLGWFNIAWSSAIIVGPLLAGYLVKHHIEMSFVATMLVMLVASAVVMTTRHRPSRPRLLPTGVPSQPAGQMDEPPPPPADPSLALPPVKVRYLRYLGWTGATVGYLAVGLYRFQMPHLATHVQMDEVVFSRVMTALALAITAAFFVTARWAGWHGKTRYIFLPQATLVAVSILLTWSTTAWVLVPLMLAAGFAAGLLYSSSVFHGSLGAPPAVRTTRMAIHEVCLNIGVITGSFLGNLLSQRLGPSRVYPYLAGAIATILLVQVVAWNVLRSRYARRAESRLPIVSEGSGLNPAATRQE